jgi:uncharacterized protein YndB with AHSA1/START domain
MSIHEGVSMVGTDEDFTLNFLLKASPATLYSAVATRCGISSWWTTHTDYDDRTGTEVSLEIEPVNENESRRVFTHAGLAPLECHDMYSSIWILLHWHQPERLRRERQRPTPSITQEVQHEHHRGERL